jgi:serine/threonine-protein kinase
VTQHIETLCPGCGHALRVRAEYFGRRVRCRYCGLGFRVGGFGGDELVGSGEFPVVPSSEFPAFGQGDGVPSSAGLELPGFEYLGLIRNGSMGQVFKARQVSVDRVVAVKVLHQALAGRAEYVERFRREARLAARLAHTHIVHLLDAGEVSGCPYLVLEYADGETAHDRIAARGPFAEGTAVAITLALAEALGHVHRRGLIHRDVKPANVILTGDGGVKLIDFGLARPLSDAAWAAAEAGNVIGTAAYISPEQTRGQSDLDPRSDLYSLGATLYHLVTGRAPYAGDMKDILRQHADPRTRPVPPDRLNPALSLGLVAVIATLMAKNREARYRDPDDLLADLVRVLRGDRPNLRAC